MQIVREESPDHLAAQLDANLCSFNEGLAGPRRKEKLGFAIREGERLLAGLFAEIFWNALHIDLLWVAADNGPNTEVILAGELPRRSGRYGVRSQLPPRARNGNRIVMSPDALGHFQGVWHPF